MRITIHGHRPASSRSSATETANEQPRAGAPDQVAGADPRAAAGETVRNINLGFFKLKLHRPTARQATLLAQLQNPPLTPPVHTSGGPQSHDDYLAHWNAWARDGGSTGGHRTEAVNRMHAWLTQGLPAQPLVLSQLQLTSLPDHLPEGLRELTASSNQLTRLPDHLPDSLVVLDVEANQLSALPQNLPSSLRWLDTTSNRLSSLPNHLPDLLEFLDVGGNQLSALPETLPESLLELNAASNRLTSLPNHLPASLQRLVVHQNQLSALPETLPVSLIYLDASHNQLTSLPLNLPGALEGVDVEFNQLRSLPNDITTRLGRRCIVNMSHNWLAQHVRSQLDEVMNAPNYQGPNVIFSMEEATHSEATRPLADVVADWYLARDQDAVRQTWNAFSSEAGADEFSKFLDRLGDTANARRTQFTQATTTWLSHLAEHAELRNRTFLISAKATSDCDDSVSLTFNEMKKVRLAADIESGDYDNRLPDLLAVARMTFRLDKLEKIAREKVASFHFVDEIEVYLAYQVKLREQLDLPLDTLEMDFFDDAHVTQDDLDQAVESIRDAEAKEFTQYFSTQWRPWQSVLRRLQPQAHAAAQDNIVEALAGDDFVNRLHARLEPLDLQNDSDAQRAMGAQVKEEIASEINGELTRTFLESKKLLHLLMPP